MKKLIAMLLALLMLVTMTCCLTACDDGEGKGTTTAKTTTTTKATTTTATKLQMSEAEITAIFTEMAEKAHRLGFYSSVYELSERGVAPCMNYLDGKVEAYGKASDGTTLYKKTVLIEDINAEFSKITGRPGLDFTSVKEGVADPATYEFKRESNDYFVYYDLDHNIKLEKYTFKINDYTNAGNLYTVSYTVDYATSADVNCELVLQYYNGNFTIVSNLEK